MRHIIVLSLLLVMASPIAAQELATPVPGVHVTLDPVTGILAWSPNTITGVSRYEILYSGRCREPITRLNRSAPGSLTIHDYDATERFIIDITAFGQRDGKEVWLGHGKADNGVPCGQLNFSLDRETGTIAWSPRSITGVKRYDVYYGACHGAKGILHPTAPGTFTIPDYDRTLSYLVEIVATGRDENGGETWLGHAKADNGVICPYLPEHLALMQTPLGPVVSIPQQVDSTGIMPGPMTPVGLTLEQSGSTDLTVGYIASAADPTPAPAAPATTLVETSMNVSPHPGSTLHVSVEGGNIHALDSARSVSLFAHGNCYAGTMLASNDSLEISCTADARFKVLQVHAQHPADGRRDILVFNATLTDCYRAYQYHATGREEIFSSVC